MTINKTSKCQKIRNSQTSSRIIVMMVSGTVVVFHSPIKCGQWNWTKLRYIGLRCIQIAQYSSRPERLSVRNVRDTVRIATSQDAMVSFVCKKTHPTLVWESIVGAKTVISADHLWWMQVTTNFSPFCPQSKKWRVPVPLVPPLITPTKPGFPSRIFSQTWIRYV